MLFQSNLPAGISRIKESGFTLIELLVVIAIIGVLATVGFGSFQSSLTKGRDAQRKHDLGQIQKALEMYLNDKGKYPTSIPNLTTSGEWRDTNGTLYMKSVPQGPRGDYYCYEADPTSTSYQLYATLENMKDPKKITPASANCASYNYGVSSSNTTP